MTTPPPPLPDWRSNPNPGFQRPPQPPAPAPAPPASESIGRTMLRWGFGSLAACAAFLMAMTAFFVVSFLLLAVVVGNAGEAEQDPLAATFVMGDASNTNVLLAIPVTGVILGEKEDRGLFGLGDVTYGYEIKARLEEAAQRDDIDGIILEMDTPGGTIFGSRAISDAVTAYRETTGKPVVAFVRGISASGGMYAMAGADMIVADHGTLVGSIGVIFGPLERYDGVIATEGGLLGGGVTTEGGITVEYITAGRGKDLLNPYRAMTDEERATLQRSVDNGYDEFVSRVGEGRDIEPQDIISDIGAFVYDEETAIELGLVDTVGNRDTAYQLAAEAAGLDAGAYQVRRLEPGQGSLFGLGAELLGGAYGGDASGGSALAPSATFCLRAPMLLMLAGPPPSSCG